MSNFSCNLPFIVDKNLYDSFTNSMTSFVVSSNLRINFKAR